MRDQRLREQVTVALARLGEDVHEVTVVPFSREVPALPFDDGRRILCYGASFVPRIATETAWRPGIYFDPALFRWSVMAARWGELMFTPDGALATAAEVLARLETGPRFVRPDADSKLFDGARYDSPAELRAALGKADPATPVVHGEPRTVDAEWRCFVADGHIVDASEYRRAGSPSMHRGAPPRVLDVVETAISRWLPATVTCVDVASSGEEFGIVEANCFNAARLYAADPDVVLAAVARCARG